VDAVGDRFEVTGREVAHRGSSSTTAQSGRRGDGGVGGGAGGRGGQLVGHTTVVDYHAAPGGSYGVEGGLSRRRGPVARRFHEASWQPMLGDGDTHKVDRGASVSIGAKRGYYALRGVVSERRLAFLMK
jgi:hypothetical protein